MPGANSLVRRAPRAAAPRRLDDMRFLTVAAAATAALDQLNHGIALIDKRCQLSFANKLARSIFQENDGLILRNNQLVGATASGSLRLSAALKSALCESEASAIRMERSTGRRPLCMQIAPLRASRGQFPIESALVSIHDSDRYAVPPKERLCEAYGLTAAEAGVVQLLLRGAGMAEIAVELRISVETVHTHLRRVLGKTGVHRQCDLILLLLRESGGGLYDERAQPRGARHRSVSARTPSG
jgi:DNA-binding CsgD family transcriptional regulator